MIFSLPKPWAWVIWTLFSSVASGYPESSPYDRRSDSLHQLSKRDRVWDHQIRCIGGVPSYLSESVDANGQTVTYDTPRSLCAKAWYGGRANANMGGHCANRPPLQRMLVFERALLLPFQFRLSETMDSPIDNVGQTNLAEMATVFCQLRCRCIRAGEPSQPRWPASEILDGDSNSALYFDKNVPVQRLAIVPRLTYSSPGAALNRPGPGEKVIYSYWLSENSLQENEMAAIMLHKYRVWFRPTCISNMPAHFPWPFAREDFADSRALCAAYYWGGYEGGSAGYVCVGNADGTARSLVQFEHLAHPSFASENGGPGMAMILWCQSICRCHFSSSKTQDSVELGNVLTADDVVAFFVDGEVHLGRSGGGPLPPGIPSTLGPEFCDGFSVRECKTLLATLKPRPKVTLIGPSLDRQNLDSQQCSGKCSGRNQCGPSCICAVQRSWAGSTLQIGSPRNSLVATCLTIIVANDMERSFQRLGGRDLSHAEASRLIECPCNSTFASNDCCEIETYPQLQHGVLP